MLKVPLIALDEPKVRIKMFSTFALKVSKGTIHSNNTEIPLHHL